ncbi:MAG: DUF1385 domain-containing protein [Chloroflexi bacterium]|nr:DUF1385 domain-containing protein [Chloroflexota bacterium]
MPTASSDRRPSRVSSTTYGGQAVLEGVMMRGRRWAAVAVRAPSSRIVVRSERLPERLYSGWISRTPFLRGLTILWDSLGLGMKALMFASDVAERGAESAEAEERAELNRPMDWTSVALMLLVAVGVFFLLPLGAAGLAEWLMPGLNSLVAHLIEGVIRLGLLVGYVWAIGYIPEVRRVFAYHGAEHMTIHAFEAGDPLDVEHIRRYSPAHPRCGTAFLLLVVALSILLFALVPTDDWLIRILSRVAGIPIVAGVAYEVLKLGGAHAESLVMRPLVAPGLALQALTTRYPEPDMIEVAVAAFEEMYRLEHGEPVSPVSGTD